MVKIRLHMPAIPHTITTDEYSHCAFTGKVKRFAPMMRSRGFEVYHYGVETSESGADKDINLLTKKEWEQLRFESYKIIHPTLSDEELMQKLTDPKQYIGNLGNLTYPIYSEFNKRLKLELAKHYRSSRTDIVCFPFGPAHEDAVKGTDFVVVESGIGYPNAYRNFRIYESYAKLHMNMQRDNKRLENYWFVCPNYFYVPDWPLCLTPKVDTIGYFGRLEHIKGINIVVEVAKIFPHIRVIICGQGDPTPFIGQKNIVYKTPIHGTERGEYLGSLMCLLAPSMWPEPFCGVSAEAQLCGTPVIGHDCGAIVENVENFKTGLLCHTLADFKYGVQNALDGKFDRHYIRERAIRLFDMYNVAKRYEYAFNSIIQIYNGTNGWYSQNISIDCMDPTAVKPPPTLLDWPIPDVSAKCSFVHKIAFVPDSFDLMNASSSENKIPRLLHFICLDESNIMSTINMWKTLMPSWIINIWSGKDINTNKFTKEQVELLNSIKQDEQKIEVMRYCVLEKYGGFFMDLNIVPNKSIEPLLTIFNDAQLLLCHELSLTWEYISNNFIACVPNHPVLKKACEMCYDAILNTEDIQINTGPFLLGHAVASVKDSEKYFLLPTKSFYRNKDFGGRFGEYKKQETYTP